MRFIHRTALLATLGMLPVCAQISSFKHVIIVVQENRTPDNLFYGLCSAPYGSASRCSTNPGPAQYNIKTSNWLNKASATGVTQPIPVALAADYSPNHIHKGFVAMCDAPAGSTVCAMDGAAGITCEPGAVGACGSQPQFAYADNSTGLINPYLEMATQYGFANYMFQTNQGPSFPAHLFLFSGTSAPSAIEDSIGTFDSENNNLVAVNAGCIAPAKDTVQLITPAGEVSGNTVYPCFEHQTLPDLLPAGYTWRYYDPGAGNAQWNAATAIAHICGSTGPGGKCQGPLFTANVDTDPAGVLKDVAACHLANLSWVIPTGQNSDHPLNNDGGGPSWVASVVNAIGASTGCDGGSGYWKDTAILVTWDDWGGFYDHVAPTILPEPQGDYQHGFRVPLVFISAYTGAGYVDNNRVDFGSILRFAEKQFGIEEGALGFADKRANTDFGNYYNLHATPRAFTPIKAPKTAEFFLNDKRKPLPPDDDDGAN